MTGVSFTVTVNEHVEVAFSVSVAVQVTVVVPAAKVLPLAGEQVTVTAPQSSVAVGSVHVATKLSHCVIFPGQALITGAALADLVINIPKLLLVVAL